MRIDDAMIGYVADLSRLRLEEGERERAKRDLEEILSHMEGLQGAKVDGVEPMTHPQPITNALRPDVVEQSFPRELLLENAPETAEGCFVTPKTVE